MKLPVNLMISITHLRSRKKQTIIASMGVTIGIALYIFSNSLMEGFSDYSRREMFKTVPAIRIFQQPKTATPILNYAENCSVSIIANPGFVHATKKLINPYTIMEQARQFSFVKALSPQVYTDIIISNGSSEINGQACGIIPEKADKLFDISSGISAGSIESLSGNPNVLIIGQLIADKLHVLPGNKIHIRSLQGIERSMQISGIYSTGNKSIDESRIYLSLSAAQQLAGHGPDYINDINIAVHNNDSAMYYAAQLQSISKDFSIEDWQTRSADTLATDRIRKIMNSSVAFAIMMVAGFGIYNILNMTISQKMNDIAILKATGFRGRDIIQIFVIQAAIMGIIGTLLGLLAGFTLIQILQRIYVGPPIHYFPVTVRADIFIIGIIFGISAALGAGYFPARRAAHIDPVEIFRK
jgi:lipoprotein-releasing system permease protein